MSKLYDCFLFYNELDILDIRLNLLKDIVDKFVILESTVTFSGKLKPLTFQENKHMFEKFSDKIIHIVVDDTPDDFNKLSFIQEAKNKNEQVQNNVLKHVAESTGWSRHEKQWGREIYQRESLVKGLVDCQEDDHIIISDVDEIPNPASLTKLLGLINSDDVIDFKQNMFYYHIDLLKEKGWSGPKLASYKTIQKSSLNALRANKLTNKVLNVGGWHISFMGGVQRIQTKIEAYAHQEFNNQHIKSNIEKNINEKNDLFFRGTKLTKINVSEEYPESFLETVRTKYPYLLSGDK